MPSHLSSSSRPYIFPLPPPPAADSGAANIAICLNKDDLGVYSSASLPFLHHIESLYEVRPV